MQPKHMKLWGVILLLTLILWWGRTVLSRTYLATPDVHSGFLWFVQEHFQEHILYTYGQYIQKNTSYTNSALIEIDGSRNSETQENSEHVLSDIDIVWNIQLVTEHDHEDMQTLYTIHIETQMNNDAYVSTWSALELDIQTHIQVYTDHILDETYVYIDQRELDQSYPQDQDIMLLDQLMSMQTNTWIKRSDTEIAMYPGRWLDMINANMQHARMVPDLKTQDGWYITTSWSWSTLESNLWPTSQQITLEDKNNELKFWLENDGTWSYDISILTSPSVQWRLDGVRELDISQKRISQKSEWNMVLGEGLDLEYIYTSETSSWISEIVAPVLHIDGEKLVQQLMYGTIGQ